MKGDFTRSTFQRRKHYTSVRMQQGRLQLDSDWNEQADIQNYLRRAQVVDMVGSDSGAPSVNPETGRATRNSFRIGIISLRQQPSSNAPTDSSPDAITESSDQSANGPNEIQLPAGVNDLVIIPGHFYANGVLCELELGSPFAAQIKDAQENQVTVPSLSIDGRSLQVGQWLEVVGPGDSASIANSTDNEPIFLQGLQIVSIDEKRRDLILQGELPANGTEIMLRQLVTYRTQPNVPPIPDAATPTTGTYVAYLDVWERHITVIDDEEIREIALNVPDTATRTKTLWQLKLLNSDALSPTHPSSSSDDSSLVTAWNAYVSTLNARTTLMNACARLCPDGQLNEASLRSLQNQLYRVEIHHPGQSATDDNDAPNQVATFKWSRDNGSTVSTIDRIEANVIRIHKTSEDAWVSSTPGQWLEITSEANELLGKPGVMVPLVRATDTKIEFDEARIINGPIPGDANQVRRWDHDTSQAPQGTIPLQTEWMELESGIRVQFDAGSTYETGDYWLIPARSAPRDIEWPNDQAVPNPQPVFQPRFGIEHDYALLATVAVAQINDSRRN
jgi:hypothetical protein